MCISFGGNINDKVSGLISIVNLLISPIIGYGYTKALILFRRKEEVGAIDFLKLGFEGFKKVWHVILSLIPKYIVPAILLIIAFSGFIFSFLMGILYIFGASVKFSGFGLATISVFIFSIVLFIIAVVWLIPIAYKYHFALYELVYNPDMTSKEIVKVTGEYMKGNRWKLFKLMFTFAGWAILTVILFGIPIFWFVPYTTIAGIFFYEKVSGRLEERNDINQLDVGPIQYENGESEENQDL